jgi:hypothetical protein
VLEFDEWDCGFCGEPKLLCRCGQRMCATCDEDHECNDRNVLGDFDADELGLDPERNYD